MRGEFKIVILKFYTKNIHSYNIKNNEVTFTNTYMKWSSQTFTNTCMKWSFQVLKLRLKLLFPATNMFS